MEKKREEGRPHRPGLERRLKASPLGRKVRAWLEQRKKRGKRDVL